MFDEHDPIKQSLVAFFAQHLVALAWSDFSPAHGPSGKKSIVSGFILETAGSWFLVTAGHALIDIQKAIENGQQLREFRLIDGNQPTSTYKHAIPFSFETARKYSANIGGTDYGIIQLTINPVQALRANQKSPITSAAWQLNRPDEFDWYFMLGIPSESLQLDGDELRYCVSLIRVQLDQNPPELLRTSEPRLYGLIPWPFGKDGQFRDLDGISGGPIFGVKKMATGEIRYWVVAIQSGWKKPTLTDEPGMKPIAATPVFPFLTELDQALKKAERLADQTIA